MPVLNGKFYPYKNYEAWKEITSLDELAKQDMVFFNGQLVHHAWFMSWQFRTAERAMKLGLIKYAIKKKENKDA